MIALRLSPEDQRLARQASEDFLAWSIASQNTSNPHQRVNKWGNMYDAKREMQIAYGAEIAVARHLGLPWNGLNNGKRKADVGENVEVRHTKSQYLIIRGNDRLEDVAFLVKGESLDRLFLVGFYPVRMARQDAYKAANEETWFVPQGDLYQMMPQKGAVKPFLAALAERSRTDAQ